VSGKSSGIKSRKGEKRVKKTTRMDEFARLVSQLDFASLASSLGYPSGLWVVPARPPGLVVALERAWDTYSSTPSEETREAVSRTIALLRMHDPTSADAAAQRLAEHEHFRRAILRASALLRVNYRSVPAHVKETNSNLPKTKIPWP
jgi:hypothetical protein